MYENIFKLPKTYNVINDAISLQPGTEGGTHYSSYGIGGFIEVMNLSDLSNDSRFVGISYNLFSDLSGIRELYLNTENTSCGKRKIGMLVHVLENDITYQFQFPNYLSSFTAATASTVGTARVVVFEDYSTVVYNLNAEASVLVNGWSNDSVEGISGATSTTAGWKVFNVISSGITSLPYVHISGDTMTGQLNVPSIYAPIIYLGNDSSGNTRTITADGSVLDFDILDGGDY